MAVQTGDRVNFVKLATPADFPSAQDIDDATLYFITSTKEVYLGSILISTGPSVTQTNSDSVNALHELLLSGSADNITRDEGARKTSHLRGNPSDGTLNISGQLTDAYGVQSSRILTQAQYNALPQAEQENGTDYYISDADPTVNQALWNKVGTDPLDTVAQNLSGAINELAPLKDDVSTISTDIGDISADIGDETLPDTTKTVKGNINAINAKVGSDTLTTTAQNLSGAINEHETDISTINSNLAQLVKTTSGSFTTNSDGVIALGIPSTALLVTCKITANGNYYLCMPYYESGVWYAKVMSSSGSLAPIANRNITVSISYILPQS